MQLLLISFDLTSVINQIQHDHSRQQQTLGARARETSTANTSRTGTFPAGVALTLWAKLSAHEQAELATSRYIPYAYCTYTAASLEVEPIFTAPPDPVLEKNNLDVPR